jgi:hypothetical protein
LSVDNNGKIYVTSPGLITSVAGVSPINSDIPAYLLSNALGLNTAAGYDVTNVVTAGDTTHLVTSAAVATAVAAVLKWKGITTTDIATNPSANPITINSQSYTAVMGDVVVLSGTSTEYLYNGSTWEPMGDEASYALKTITITGTGYLTGGGTLEANRTLDITSSVKTKIDNGATAYGYFSDGKILATAMPNMYIGDAQVKFTAQTSQDIGGLGNLTMSNAMYLRAYNSTGDTLYNLAGLTSSNYGYFGAANSPRTYLRAQTLYFLTGDNGNTTAITLSKSQSATFYGDVICTNNKLLYWKNSPAAGEDTVNIAIMRLTSSNQLQIGSGLIKTGTGARAYPTYIYGSSIYFHTGTADSGATTRWYISSSGTFLPYADNTYQIGTSSRYVKTIYSKSITLAPGVYIEVDSNGYVHLHGDGFYCDGFISAGGLSTGGGTTGIDEAAMWSALGGNSGEGLNKQIHPAHIPDMASTYGYLKSEDISDMATKTWVATQNFSTVTNTVSNVAVGGSGHTEELAITKGGTTSYLTVPYANTVKRFKRYDGTQDVQGGYDLNTLLAGGGITSQYNSVYTWGNGPDGMRYGGVVQLNPFV